MTDTLRSQPPGSPLEARALLELYRLDLRAAVVETAAALDRLERAPGGAALRDDPWLGKIRAACRELAQGGPGRVERVLELFSDPA